MRFDFLFSKIENKIKCLRQNEYSLNIKLLILNKKLGKVPLYSFIFYLVWYTTLKIIYKCNWNYIYFVLFCLFSVSYSTYIYLYPLFNSNPDNNLPINYSLIDSFEVTSHDLNTFNYRDVLFYNHSNYNLLNYLSKYSYYTNYSNSLLQNYFVNPDYYYMYSNIFNGVLFKSKDRNDLFSVIPHRVNINLNNLSNNRKKLVSIILNNNLVIFGFIKFENSDYIIIEDRVTKDDILIKKSNVLSINVFGIF